MEPLIAVIGGVGWQELVIILVIVLVVFGASRVPKLMRGMGEGIKEFKEAVKTDDETDESAKSTESDKQDDK